MIPARMASRWDTITMEGSSCELLLKEDGTVQQIRRAETLQDYFSTFDTTEFASALGL